MNVKEFLVGIGHGLASAFRLVKKIIPEEQLLAGIELAAAAATKFTDNPPRRAWVIAQLQARFHIPESIARLIVELAVSHLKDAAKDAAATAAGAVTSPI